MNKAFLIDAFLFYNELDLLKVRLEYLGNRVDQFVIVESNIDFSGKEKSFFLNDELIRTLPYADKILYHREHINLNSLQWVIKRIRYYRRINRFLWKIQDAQRNSLLKPLKRFKPSDIVIFSDLDEFPNEKAISESISNLNDSACIKSQTCFSCEQIFFYYNVKNAVLDNQFYGSIITNIKTLRNILPHKLRSQKDSLPHIKNGGWHFSYFMDEEKILGKILAISDVENLSSFKSLSKDEISKKILGGLDLYDRQTKLSDQQQHLLPDKILQYLRRYLPNCV